MIMWFLYLLNWIALFVQIAFLTLSLAAGLYYLAELVEEYTVLTGRIIKFTILAIVAVYLGLIVFEEMPLTLTATGLATHLVYLLLLKTFPYIELTSPVFLLSVVMIVVNHYLAFSYFSTVWYPFSEMLAFFTLCLWLVPFAFFVSLSANDNVLPTMAETRHLIGDNEGDVVTNYFRRKGSRYGLLSFLKRAQDSILPQKIKKGY